MSSRDYRLFVSAQAQQDIAGILHYTGKTWGRNQLLIYRDKLHEAVKTIGLSPNLGHGTPELSETHRLYFVGSHVVVYRMHGDMISVVRVRRQRPSLVRHVQASNPYRRSRLFPTHAQRTTNNGPRPTYQHC